VGEKAADSIAALAFVSIAFVVSQLVGWTALVIAAVLVVWRERASR
jgi:hypothetical protein